MSTIIPKTQKAWIVENRGLPAEVLSIHTDWPVPTDLKDGEILVKIEAAALNPSSYKLMQWLPSSLVARPVPPEFDFSGEVVDANGSSKFKNGDKVFGWLDVFGYAIPAHQGTLLQYTKVPSTCISLRPSNITASEAAGLALAGITAYQALYVAAQVKPGQTIFINGGSSSVGADAIQIAKAKGVKKIVASCSPKHTDQVRGYGADEVVDYTSGPLHETLKAQYSDSPFDAIVDAIGLSDPILYIHSPEYLKPEGIFAATIPHPRSLSTKEFTNSLHLLWASNAPNFLPGSIPRTWTLVKVEQKEQDIEELYRLTKEGYLKPSVDSVYEFEDVLQAYDKIMGGHAAGKVIVRIDPTSE